MTEPFSRDKCPGHRISAYIIASLPPLFWSGNFLLARLMRDDIPPLQMSFWRWVFAFLILLPFCLAKFNEYKTQIRKELKYLLLLGLVGVTAYNCFIYSAMHFTTVVNASIINSLMPVVTFMFAMLLLKDRPAMHQITGVVIALAGACMIIFRGDVMQIMSLSLNPGDLLVLCALTFWACYTVLIRWRPTRLPSVLFLFVTIGFGVLFHLPLITVEYYYRGGFDLTAAAVGSIAYFAIFPSIFAYLSWNKAVEILGPGKTVIFIYLLPIYGALLGKVFLDEAFYIYHGLGIFLIFTGMLLVTRESIRGN
jgi:drug/metabolite transporter (DMT)-like permease